MDSGLIDTIMKKWASRQLDQAPDIAPTEEIRQKVREKHRPSRLLVFPKPARWAAVGIAVAATVWLVLLNRPLVTNFLEKPSARTRTDHAKDRTGPSREKDQIGLSGQQEKVSGAAQPMKEPDAVRPEKDLEKAAPVSPPSAPQGRKELSRAAKPMEEPVALKSEKGLGRTTPGSPPLVLQYRKTGDSTVINIIIPNQQETEIVLDPRDNYRLAFQPDRTWHAAVFYRDSLKTFLRLFPNARYSSVSNPFEGARSALLPEAPAWFPHGKIGNEGTLHIVISREPIGDLDSLYEEYFRSGKIRNREQILLRWLEAWTSLEKDDDEILFWSRIKIRSS